MLKPNDVVIVSYARTPFDKFGGDMRDIPSIDLGIEVLKAVTEKVGMPKDQVEEVLYGGCMHQEIGLYQNIPARQATLRAGFPPETVSLTIDRACCSSMMAVQMAYKDIKNGDASIAIAMGSENMSNIPYLVIGARWGKRIGHLTMDDQLFAPGYRGWSPVALDAGNVAAEYNVSREEQDQWAYQSQQRYAQAKAEGKFKDEIVPIQVKASKGPKVIDEDTSPRPEVTLESLAKLRTVYESPTVTAGNAPGLSAGASAILLMSAAKAQEMGIKPLAVIHGAASVADVDKNIPVVPAKVIQKILAQTGTSLDDIDLIEINEAFAAVPLVATKILADGDAQKLARLRSITNVNGGAVAIGHPVGATGARLVMTLVAELKRRGGGKGIAGICGGLAQGDGVLVEVL